MVNRTLKARRAHWYAHDNGFHELMVDRHALSSRSAVRWRDIAGIQSARLCYR